MLFAVNMASGAWQQQAVSRLCILWTTPGRTSLWMLAFVRSHEEDGHRPHGLFTHLRWYCCFPWRNHPVGRQPGEERHGRFIHVLAGTDSHHNGCGYQLFLRHCPQASLHALRCEHGDWEVMAAAGGFTTVYPLEYARTHLGMLARQFLCPIA